MKRFLIGTVVMMLGVSAFALTGYYNAFATTYKLNKTSGLGAQSCAICHVSKKAGKLLNPYGKDIAAAMKAAKTHKLTPEILRKVEKLDSTKSGATNISKILKGKNPGVK